MVVVAVGGATVLASVEPRADGGAHYGIVEADKAGLNVPAGISGWELSADKRILKKADGDVRARTSEPSPLVRTQSAFVAVTLRVWPERRRRNTKRLTSDAHKEAWAQERAAELGWREVRVLDAIDVAAWWSERAEQDSLSALSAVAVTTVDAWNCLTRTTTPLLLLPDGGLELTSEQVSAATAQHHVLLVGIRRDPAQFVELLSTAGFRRDDPKSGDVEEVREPAKNTAQNCQDLLDSLHQLPGARGRPFG